MSNTTTDTPAHAEHGFGPDHVHHIRTYAYVFIALLALLGAAVAVAYIPTEDYRIRFWLTFLAYTIAVIKGVLIILWFMHVKESSRLTWLFAGASFFFIIILLGLILNDYSTRHVIPQPYTEAPSAQFQPTGGQR